MKHPFIPNVLLEKLCMEEGEKRAYRCYCWMPTWLHVGVFGLLGMRGCIIVGWASG
jgi:hypothetical protein